MKLLRSLDINDLLFIDIETVPLVEKLEPNTALWESWDYKVRHNRDNQNFQGELPESFIKNAALYAEFSKIVTICIGSIKNDALVVKSFTNDDEQALLKDFCTTLQNITAANKRTRLVGHAIIGFDIPFIMRRCIANQIELPTLIDIADLKPWELTTIDTLPLWKATGFAHASLINICVALGIISPKDEMEGFQTTEYYYGIKDGLQLIEKYCVKDVLAVANVIRRFRYEPLVELNDSSTIKAKPVGVLDEINNTKSVTVEQKNHLKTKIDSLDSSKKAIANELLNVVTN